MNSRRFAGVFAAIFILGAFPLLLVQPSGSASAGLNAGFMVPLAHIFHMVVFIAVGLWATHLGEDAAFMLPLTFVLMLTVGAALELNIDEFPLIKTFILGAMLLFAISVSLVQSRAYLLSVAIGASIAFHLGGFYMQGIPNIAAPLYYLLGIIICVSLVLAAGACAGIALKDEVDQLFGRLREMPAIATFLSFF